MLRRSLKTYLGSHSSSRDDSDDIVDETGIDILEALDVFSINCIPSSSVCHREDDLHSARVGDLALHSPRDISVPGFHLTSPRRTRNYANLQKSRANDAETLLKGYCIQSTRRVLDLQLKGPGPGAASVHRKDVLLNLQQNRIRTENILAIRRGRDRCKLSVLPTLVPNSNEKLGLKRIKEQYGQNSNQFLGKSSEQCSQFTTQCLQSNCKKYIEESCKQSLGQSCLQSPGHNCKQSPGQRSKHSPGLCCKQSPDQRTPGHNCKQSPGQRFKESAEQTETYVAEETFVNNQQSAFTGFFSETNKNILRFPGKLCSDGDNLDVCLVEVHLITGAVKSSTAQQTIHILISAIHTIQVDDGLQLLRLLWAKEKEEEVLVLHLNSQLHSQTFLSALEFVRRRSQPRSAPFLAPAPPRIKSKFVCCVVVGEWVGGAGDHTNHSTYLGQFWVKEGDHADTRDWDQIHLYIKRGVVYGCVEEGGLPQLVVSLADLPRPLPPQAGARFLLQLGTSLTLSSHSSNLVSWTREVIIAASSAKPPGQGTTQIEAELPTTKLKSFHFLRNELVMFEEPGGQHHLSVNLASIFRVITNLSSQTLQLAWMENPRTNAGLGGLIRIGDANCFEDALKNLAILGLNVGTFLRMGEQLSTPDMQSFSN